LALEGVLRDGEASSAERVIGEFLVESGLSREAPSSSARIGAPAALTAPPPSLLRESLGLVLFGVLATAGGAVLYGLEWQRSGSTRPATTQVELARAKAGYLRVVAEPWAHVVVDGARVETTPFARAIPLAAGTHYVRLEHPNAPTERRTVHLVSGETVLLDVKMQVQVPREPLAAADAAADAPPPSP
jgi:serine/threonine-protein kinase